MPKLKIAIAAAVVTALGAGYFFYDRYTTRYPSTDDAYVQADVVHVAPQVSGPVAQLFVSDQQFVHAGDPLFALDRQPFELALEKARAHLANVQRTLAQNEAAVASAEAEVQRTSVLLQNSELKAKRTVELQKSHYLPQQTADDAQADFRATRAAYDVAQAKLTQARQSRGTPGDQNEAVREARAALGQAEWDLAHTRVSATCDGRIGELTLQQGDAARAGTANFVLICNRAFWIEANFKETDLERIRAGQTAVIHVDMYPGREFKGQVESINGSSGVAFSLLPPQNASGNWVKVTQRVPVRVKVLEPDPKHPLLVGTSAHVRIDTGSL